MHDLPLALRLLVQHGLGYIRSTQVLPMIAAWVGIWGIGAAFAFVNFQEESLTVLSALGALADRLAWLPTPGPLGTTADDGSLILDEEDVQKIVVTYWGILSAALYLVSMIVVRVRGRRPALALRRRLGIAVALGVATLAAFVALFIFSAQPFQGSPASWFMVFLALSALPVGVSLYSLTVTYIIDRTRDAVLGAPPNQRERAPSA
jgi:hypothetical protein